MTDDDFLTALLFASGSRAAVLAWTRALDDPDSTDPLMMHDDDREHAGETA